MWNANADALGQLKTTKEWIFVGGAGSSGDSANANAANPSGRTGPRGDATNSSPVIGGEVVKKGSDLKTLMDIGNSRESGLGAVVLEAVFEELAAQTK